LIALGADVAIACHFLAFHYHGHEASFHGEFLLLRCRKAAHEVVTAYVDAHFIIDHKGQSAKHCFLFHRNIRHLCELFSDAIGKLFVIRHDIAFFNLIQMNTKSINPFKLLVNNLFSPKHPTFRGPKRLEVENEIIHYMTRQQELHKQVIPVTKRALKGNLPESTRMVTIDWGENYFHIKGYLDREVTQDDREDFGIISTEVIASFPDMNDVKEEVFFSDKPIAELPALREVVYIKI